MAGWCCPRWPAAGSTPSTPARPRPPRRAHRHLHTTTRPAAARPTTATAVLPARHGPHSGQLVAPVVAETPEQAREAAEAVRGPLQPRDHDVELRRPTDGSTRWRRSTPPSPRTPPRRREVDVRTDSPRPPSSWTPNTPRPKSTTTPWSRTRRRPAGTGAASTWSTPTRGACGSRANLAKLFSLDPACRTRDRATRPRRFGSKGTPGARGRHDGRDRLVSAPSTACSRGGRCSPASATAPPDQRIRLGATKDGSAPRSSTAPPADLDRARVRRAERLGGAGDVRRPTHTTPGTGSYGSMCRPRPGCVPGGGTGLVRAGVRVRRTRRAVRYRSDRAAHPQ